jgi:hypothetical protein
MLGSRSGILPHIGLPPDYGEGDPRWVLETHFLQFPVHTPKGHIGDADEEKPEEKIGITKENRPKKVKIRHKRSG